MHKLIFGNPNAVKNGEFVEIFSASMLKAEASKEAMKHPDTLGAGAKKRKKIKNKKNKMATVMAEFQRGTLHSSSGEKVTDPMQAVAIAYSEAGLSRKKKGKKK